MAVRVHMLTDSCISLTNSSVYHHAFDFDFDIERREGGNRGQHTRGEDLQKKKIEARVRFTLIRKGEGGEDNCTAPVDEGIGIHVHVYSHYHTTGQLSLYVE